MTTCPPSTISVRLLGTTGLLLVVIVARLAPLAIDEAGGTRRGLAASLARIGLDAIGLVGATVDRLTARRDAVAPRTVSSGRPRTWRRLGA